MHELQDIYENGKPVFEPDQTMIAFDSCGRRRRSRRDSFPFFTIVHNWVEYLSLYSIIFTSELSSMAFSTTNFVFYKP